MSRLRFQKIFVTNPTSIVGAHTINALVRSGYQVQYLLRHPFASQQQHFERINEDACYNPFLIPPTAQPGDPIYETTCEKALDGVNAIVYTGPSTVQELVNWPTIRTALRQLVASAQKVQSPIKSIVFHTPALGIDSLPRLRASRSVPCPAPRHLPTQTLIKALETWRNFRPSPASKDSSNPLLFFRVTNIASASPLSLRPQLGEGVSASPAFRELVTPLQELDWHPPSLFTHHWVDPRDLAEIISRAVTRDLVKFASVPIPLYFHKTMQPPPPEYLLSQYLVVPPRISESSGEAIRNLMLERHPEHPDAVAAAADCPAPILPQISEDEQKKTRLLLGRDWTPPEQTIRDLLGQLGPDIPAMTANTTKLQDQAIAFLEMKKLRKKMAASVQSKSAESEAKSQRSTTKARAKAPLKSKVEGTSPSPLLGDNKAKSRKKQSKKPVKASSTPTPVSVEKQRSGDEKTAPSAQSKSAESEAKPPHGPTKVKAKDSPKRKVKGTSSTPLLADNKTKSPKKQPKRPSRVPLTPRPKSPPSPSPPSTLKNNVEEWRAFLAEFAPPAPPKPAAPARKIPRKSKTPSNRVSTAKASSSSSSTRGINRVGRPSKRREVKRAKAGAAWGLLH